MASIDPITLRLRELEVVVRCGEARDAEALIELADHIVTHGEGQVLEPGERTLTGAPPALRRARHRRAPRSRSNSRSASSKALARPRWR